MKTEWLKEIAKNIEARSYGWVVLYGEWSRRFWAFACWDVPEPTVIWAPNGNELELRMRRFEEHYRAQIGAR